MRLLQYALVLALFFVHVTSAKADPLALGVIIGSQSGFSFKYNMSEQTAIDGAISYSSDSSYGNSVHVDYLFDRARVFSAGKVSPLNFYYGVGLRFTDIRRGDYENKDIIAIRAPFGVQHSIVNPDLDFFAEIAPALEVTPRSDVVFDVGLGIRYRF